MDVSSTLLTIRDWQDAYLNGASPRELLEGCALRLRAQSPAEAWIVRTGTAALRDRIDVLEARLSGCPDRQTTLRAMPLFGIPFAVKDNIDVAGLPTTAACPAFERLAASNASAAKRLLDAGAVCMGKTNLDQFATGLVGARSPYGRPSSTFADDRVSGGSSSGSAVVVSRGDVPFALGTDTAGSGRIPAGFNNIVGLKPTFGRVSCTGVLPACRSIDCVSIFALTVADAAAVLAVIEGPDATDAYGAFLPGAAALGGGRRHGHRGTLHVGVPKVPVFEGGDGYAVAFAAAAGQLEALGHRIVPVDLTRLDTVADLLYDGPWVAERHTVVQALLERDPGALDPAVRRVVEQANAFSATDAFRGLYALQEAQRDCAALWHDLDLMMVPTAPCHPRHVEIDADPLGANARLGRYTNFVNLLGWCALAMPAGWASGGLPFGVTFIAPAGADAALARFGQQWEAAVALPLGATGRSAGLAPKPSQSPQPSQPLASAPQLWPATTVTLPIAVVGAHLSGLPLNGQLTERGALLQEATRTSARYRLFALPDTVPPKPGLQRLADDAREDGASIAVEVWDLPLAEVGSLLQLIAPPLGLGSIELADGRWVHGFVCEAHALTDARDISSFGGWRAFLAAASTTADG